MISLRKNLFQIALRVLALSPFLLKAFPVQFHRGWESLQSLP